MVEAEGSKVRDFSDLAYVTNRIVEGFQNYLLSGDPKDLKFATERVTQLRRHLEKELGRKYEKTIPLGLLDSAGPGFSVAPQEVIQAASTILPDANLPGFIRLSPETAQFTANTFWALYAQQKRVPNGITEITNPTLESLVKHLYVPTPEPIGGMPVVGPIPGDETFSYQFLPGNDQTPTTFQLAGTPGNGAVSYILLPWVQGSTLQQLLPELNAFANTSSAGKEFKNTLIRVAARMTGVFHAAPPPGMAMPQNPDRFLHDYYRTTLLASLTGANELLRGIELTEDQLGRLEKFIDALVETIPITNGKFGNVGRYFDAVPNNFIIEGGPNGGHMPAFIRSRRGDHTDEDTLYGKIRRIDFSHVAKRQWAVFEEDVADITENTHIKAQGEERARIHAYATLTRMAIQAYLEGDVRRAAELADGYRAVAQGEKPQSVRAKQWRDYTDTFRKTVVAMPFFRKDRLGYLKIAYAAKAFALQEATGRDYRQERDDNLDDAGDYFQRSAAELPRVSRELGLEKSLVGIEGLPVMNDILHALANAARTHSINEGRMLEVGRRMLDTYA
ncbi:hypothetical protein HYU18_03505 [Candidatus Woesearchaeota archaeon]|nr:hypothetical protein [Candidatus Woesearchaeota archaeon]